MLREKLLRSALSGLLLLCVPAPAAHAAPAAEGKPSVGMNVPAPPKIAFLPDTLVLARVGDRKVTVFDFRDGYYNTTPDVRPNLDSLGRVEFLQNCIRKEVLGLTATAMAAPLGFEDRGTVRAYSDVVLANRLYQLDVKDSATVTDADVQRIYGYYGSDQKMRVLFFRDRPEAERIRAQLRSGVLPWSVAAAKYALRGVQGANDMGELDWRRFDSFEPELGMQLWALQPGQISDVIVANTGYHLVQVTARRPRKAPEFNTLAKPLRTRLLSLRVDDRRLRIMNEAKAGLDVRYDSTNVAWAASHFTETISNGPAEGLGQTLNINMVVPDFEAADTSRTLMSWKDGKLSLGTLVRAWADLQPLSRPSINTPERFMDYADAVAMGPRLTEMARARGLEKDSLVVEAVDRKIEEIRVGHLVDDSVFTHVQVSDKERRDYYKAHPKDYVSYPSVTYAMLVRRSKAGADSVAAQLDQKVPVAKILHADSLAGVYGSWSKHMRSNESSPFKKVLFEEMRPGQHRVMGPDKDKQWVCMVLMEYDEGKLLPYDQVAGMIDESLHNIRAEEALNAFVQRLSVRYPVAWHPELVMRIKPSDPASD